MAPYSIGTSGEGRIDASERLCRSLDDAPNRRIADVYERMVQCIRDRHRESAPNRPPRRSSKTTTTTTTTTTTVPPATDDGNGSGGATATATATAAAVAPRRPMTMSVIHENLKKLLDRWTRFEIRWLTCDFHDMVVEMRQRPARESVLQTLTEQYGLVRASILWMPFPDVETCKYGAYAALLLRMSCCECMADDVRDLIRPRLKGANDLRVIYELYDQHVPLSLCCEHLNRYSDVALCDRPFEPNAPENIDGAAQRLGVFVTTYQHWYPNAGKALHCGSVPNLTSLIPKLPLWSESDPQRPMYPTANHEVMHFIRSLPTPSVTGSADEIDTSTVAAATMEATAAGAKKAALLAAASAAANPDAAAAASGEGGGGGGGGGGGNDKKKKKVPVKLRDRGNRAVMRDLESLLYILRRAFPQKSAARAFGKGIVVAFRSTPTVYHAFVRMLACTLLGVYPDTEQPAGPELRRAVYRWFVVEYPSVADIKDMLLRRVYTNKNPEAEAAATAAPADENADNDGDSDSDSDSGSDSDSDGDDDDDGAAAAAKQGTGGKTKKTPKMFLAEFVGIYAVRECIYYNMKQVVGMYRMMTAMYGFDRTIDAELKALDTMRQYTTIRLRTVLWRHLTPELAASTRPSWQSPDEPIRWYLPPWAGFPHVARHMVHDQDTDIGPFDWSSPWFGTQFHTAKLLISARVTAKDNTFSPMETPLYDHVLEVFTTFDADNMHDAEYARVRKQCSTAYRPLLRAMFDRIERPLEVGISFLTAVCGVNWTNVRALENAVQLYSSETRRSPIKKSLTAIKNRSLFDANVLRVFFEEQRRRCGFHALPLPHDVLCQQMRTFCRYYGVQHAEDLPVELSQYYICMHCGTFGAEVVNNAYTTGVPELTKDARLRRIVVARRNTKGKKTPKVFTMPKTAKELEALRARIRPLVDVHYRQMHNIMAVGVTEALNTGVVRQRTLPLQSSTAAVVTTATPPGDPVGAAVAMMRRRESIVKQLLGRAGLRTMPPASNIVEHMAMRHMSTDILTDETCCTHAAKKLSPPSTFTYADTSVPGVYPYEHLGIVVFTRADAQKRRKTTTLDDLALDMDNALFNIGNSAAAAAAGSDGGGGLDGSADVIIDVGGGGGIAIGGGGGGDDDDDDDDGGAAAASDILIADDDDDADADVAVLIGAADAAAADANQSGGGGGGAKRSTSSKTTTTTAASAAANGRGRKRSRGIRSNPDYAQSLALLRREKIQCESHDLRVVNMLGRMVYVYGTYYLMCPLCLSITTYSAQKYSAVGFSCGVCMPLEELRGEIAHRRNHNTCGVECLLCPSDGAKHPLEKVYARRVLDDGARSGVAATAAAVVASGRMTLETVYLCEEHVFAGGSHNAEMVPRLSEVLRRFASSGRRSFLYSKRRIERGLRTVGEDADRYDEQVRKVWNIPVRPEPPQQQQGVLEAAAEKKKEE